MNHTGCCPSSSTVVDYSSSSSLSLRVPRPSAPRVGVHHSTARDVNSPGRVHSPSVTRVVDVVGGMTKRKRGAGDAEGERHAEGHLLHGGGRRMGGVGSSVPGSRGGGAGVLGNLGEDAPCEEADANQGADAAEDAGAVSQPADEAAGRTSLAARAAAMKWGKPGKSKFKGVCWLKEKKKWRARIMVRGKRVYLGFYEDEEEAARAVTEYLANGTVPPPARGARTSESRGVCFDKRSQKWKAQIQTKEKKMYLGYYTTEEAAAKAVTDYLEHGTVPPPARVSGASEFRGVSWLKANSKWQATVKVKGKQTYLGSYEKEEDAARAVNAYLETGIKPPRVKGIRTSDFRGVCWDKTNKKWRALIVEKGKKVYLGYHANEEDAAKAVTAYVENGTVPTYNRERGTSAFKGVYYDKAKKKFLSQLRVGGKRVYLGWHVKETDAAKAVTDYLDKLDSTDALAAAVSPPARGKGPSGASEPTGDASQPVRKRGRRRERTVTEG